MTAKDNQPCQKSLFAKLMSDLTGEKVAAKLVVPNQRLKSD